MKKIGTIKGKWSRNQVPNKKNIDNQLRDKRLEVRVSHATIEKLEWICGYSVKLTGMSKADIIEYLIDEHVMMQELYNYDLPRFKLKEQ